MSESLIPLFLTSDTPIYLALGCVAGLLAGLLGVGGGLVIVPGLLFIFSRLGLAPQVLTHLAVGTSLLTIVATALSSTRAHHRLGGIRWPVVFHLMPGILLGVWAGAGLAHLLPGDWLKRLFGTFLLLVAAQMAGGFRRAGQRPLPGWPGMLGAGGVIGVVSALVGIGGGTLTVPFLQYHSVAIRQAVGTSAAVGLPIALAGALGFMVAGWQQPDLPPASTGYVYWPAVPWIMGASVLLAPLGARLAHRLQVDLLRRLFALLLLVMGVRLLLG
jgi:uncharacterized protein